MLYFAIFTAFIILLGVLSVYNGTKRVYNRTITAMVCLLVLAFPPLYVDSLSKARPIEQDYFLFDVATVVGHYVDYGEAIYYLFEIEGVDGPRFYKEEWSESSKERIRQLQKEGPTLYYEPTLEDDKRLSPAMPKMPEKIMPEDTDDVQRYDL